MNNFWKQNGLNGKRFNEDVFESVCREIRVHSGHSIPQPVMIIGETGGGKTTVLKRIYQSDVCRDMRTVWIDGRTLFSSEDIMTRAIDAKASIVFVDDMDFYFIRCSFEEQFRLRRFLYNEGAPMLIGTVSKIMPAFTEYEAPFFEGLKNQYVSPVDFNDIKCLFEGKDIARAESLMRLLPPTVKSVETVCNVMRLNDNPANDTAAILSLFSEKYRNVYQSLPTNSQHILNSFGSDTKPMTLREIRQKTGLPTHILTAYLKSLRDVNLLRVDKSEKRNTKYSMRDALFQIWLTHS